MNWKNVYYLMQVERKSGRLLRGTNSVRYKENRVLAYCPYWLPVVMGIVVGFLSGFLASSLFAAGEIQSVVIGLFTTLPTIVLISTAVLTLFPHIQNSGVKRQAETPYWLPITWQEHTLASVLASLLGFPLSILLFIVSTILVFSVFSGLILIAIATSITVFAAAFLASTFMEILRVLQVRFTGAVYKSSGRGAIWVRFASSLAFFFIFFILYFIVIYRGFDFLPLLPGIQNSISYIPFVWLGVMLSNFFLLDGNILLGITYMVLSICFISGLYALAVSLNKRFGLYEPPAIRVQKGGTYTPKTGFLGKLGFTTSEAALIHKDFKAFTRRRELITIFITPVLFMLIPLMQSFSTTSELLPYNTAMTFLFPASFMVMLLGSLIIGQEGHAIWRIYASPISAKSLVKSKYFFTILFGFIMLAITGTFGIILYKLSTTMILIGFLEASFLIIALSTISLNNGFTGADFKEIPRPRMIRQSWTLINMAMCALVGIVILLPLLPTVISLLEIGSFPSLNPFIATAISGTISVTITIILYKLTLNRAKDFLKKAEV